MTEPDAIPETLEETRKALLDLAHGRFGKLPHQRVVEHIIAVTPEADWPVRSAALDALHRRLKFADRDELVVTERPPRGTLLGTYRTGRAGAARDKRVRPYVTRLDSIAPLAGVCDCPDYLLGSLGLCKHLLCVLADLFASPARARAAESARQPGRQHAYELHVVWDPIRPLRGAGDRLAGLRIHGRSELPKSLAAKFFTRPDRSHARRIETSVLADPERRAALIGELERLTGDRASRATLGADPCVTALLRDERERTARRLEGLRDASKLLAHTRTLARTLYPYQVQGVRRFLEAGHLLLADDMGLGKTTQAIAAAHALYRAGRIHRGLLIVPAALKSQWLREWQSTTDVPLAAVDGTLQERAKIYAGLRSGFLVIGYEQLLRDLAAVQAMAPEMVVLDEAQRIKNFATKTAVFVKALTPRYRLVLTGTPMENRLEELASILDWIDPMALAPKWRLDPWHTVRTGDGAGGQAGARNLDTLRARMAPSFVRRVRKEVLTQLPSRTDTRVPVPMTEAQRSAHDDYIQSIAEIVARAKRRPLTQAEFLKLMSYLTMQRIISNGLGQARFDELWPTYQRALPDPSLLEGLFAPKLLEFRRLIENVAIAQGRRVVVFSQWRKMLRLAEWSVRDICKAARVRSVFFTGAESQKIRTQNIVDFHDEPDVRVMFLSDAGGVGLNLQNAANCCINLELPWNPAVLEQRIGRIYRLGQKRPIDVYNLVNDYGIESRIASLVASKKAMFVGLFDGTSDEVLFDGKASFLSDVEKLVAVTPEITAAAEATPMRDAGADDDTLEAVDASGSDLTETAEATAAVPLTRETVPGNVLSTDVARSLVSSLVVRRTDGGGIVIEAPPASAASLVALLDGLARAIQAAG